MQEKILVTGGTGFIGINLIREILISGNSDIIVLSKNTNKLPVNNKRIKIFKVDIAKETIPERLIKDCASIIHLASIIKKESSKSDISSIVETNVLGTARVLESAVKNKIKKFILFSTSGVYKDRVSSTQVDELYPTYPINLYTATKLAAEKIGQSIHIAYGLPLTIVRPANVFGPWQEKSWMIPLFISRLRNNKLIYLNHNGIPKRDWIYITDLTRAIVAILNSPSEKINGQVFNIGSGVSTSNLSVAKRIARELNKSTDLIQLISSGKTESFDNLATSHKISKLLGWRPRYSFLEGLRKTVQWYNKEIS